MAADRNVREVWADHRARLEAGFLLGRARTSNVVDAVVAHTAAALGADVVTGERADIAHRLVAAGADLRIIDI
ncbi:MAG: hypothetical protein M3Y33_10965 [Actinomycetota bacterium]|nr:hypothetical protein [Actinomycetota bacterium]